MEIEFHQLDLRYQSLRRRSPEREKRLLASLAQHGQQMPIVVVAAEGGARAVVDGYKRVRALKTLKADTVEATVWELPEAEALLLERLMRSAEGDGPFEQAWLLHELVARFELAQTELARRFDKSVSWVCRRLALVEELPEEIQRQVREGTVVAHAAMKYLVPLARANRADAVKLVAGLGGRRPSSREMGALYGAWLHGGAKSRELLLADPWLFLKTQEELQRAKVEPSASQAAGGLRRTGRNQSACEQTAAGGIGAPARRGRARRGPAVSGAGEGRRGGALRARRQGAWQCLTRSCARPSSRCTRRGAATAPSRRP